jgi:hypothetical protein
MAKTITRQPETTVEESKKIHYNCLWITAALAAVFLLGTACQSSILPQEEKDEQFIKTEKILKERKKIFYKNVLPDALSAIKSGDLITRMGTDITSILLSKINTTDTSYSHCGIAMIENDTVFIYHSMGGEFNPDQKMLRESIYRFASPENSKAIGIFRPKLTTAQMAVLTSNLLDKYEAGLMFDLDFDLATDKRQYCAEMVAKCLGKAMDNNNWVVITETENLRYIKVESLYLNDKMDEIKRYHY